MAIDIKPTDVYYLKMKEISKNADYAIRACEKAMEACKDAEPYTQYSAENRVREALEDIEKVLGNG